MRGTNPLFVKCPFISYHLTNGPAGANGLNGGNAKVGLFHGTDVALEAELEGGKKSTVAITGATADAAGLATVTFTVKNTSGAAVTGLGAANGASFAIASLEPKGNNAYNRWVPYIYNTSATATVNQGYRERGAFVEGPAGTYTYTFAKNLSTATYPIGGAAITYDRSRTHRVMVAMRASGSGYVGGTTFDFVPAGGAVSETRDIVEDATCRKCHKNTPGHYGPWDGIVKACVMCHSPNGKLVAEGGATPSIEASEMIHKIHAGRELASAPGADGIFFDDSLTSADESADNGTYNLGELSSTWRSAAFPAVIENCVACHTGSGANVDNWKSVPSRAACGSCHDLINWATGTNHAGGAEATDVMCFYCHPGTGNGVGKSVTTAHNWTANNIQNIPEFTVTATTSTPANGTHYVAGESPVVTVVLKNAVTGVTIDHTTVVEDTSAEGCTVSADKLSCTNAADGLFRAANMYVTGPRALRVPVLTTNARAYVASATTGPWDLSAGASLRVIVDNGNFVTKFNHDGEDTLVPGDFTVTLPAGTLSATATAADVAAWLNGSTATFVYNERNFKFSDRAIAYVGGRLANDAGKLGIRTRGLGSVNPSIQVPDTTSDLAGMFTNHAVGVTGGAVQLRQRASAANADPKFAATAASLTYTLDPVDDLVPGTYMINLEFADRGNPGAATYRTPSIAVATFQVKQAAEEKQIADGCTSCHWSTNAVGQGVGFVLDPVRHNKPFNAQAVDQCGGCHEYASAETVASRTWTTGGSTKPISKRVHAVHMGAGLQTPVLTVDHEESVWGRNWQITYPMDIRNCESCHSSATSGTWKTKPGRVACMGCHDTAAALAHMKTQVLDPTPTAPWSGDEQESCAACH